MKMYAALDATRTCCVAAPLRPPVTLAVVRRRGLLGVVYRVVFAEGASIQRRKKAIRISAIVESVETIIAGTVASSQFA